MRPLTATRCARALPLLAGLLLVLLAAGACDDGARQNPSPRRPIGQPQGGMQASGERPSRDLPPEVAARLDSGNRAYRRGDYRAAAEHFRAAAAAGPAGEAAGWFGVYMARKALGNDAAADSALARAGELSGTAEMHPAPTASDSAGAGSGWRHPDTTGASRWQHPDTTDGSPDG